MSDDQVVDGSGEAGSEETPPSTLTKADLILDAALKDKDGDKFGHTEIAGIVSNLSAHVEMPVNIALFGPWGLRQVQPLQPHPRRTEGTAEKRPGISGRESHPVRRVEVQRHPTKANLHHQR